MPIQNVNKKWKNKFHYVSWSGGLDSTYLLDRISHMYSTQEQPVYTISFCYPYIDKNKEKMEKRARTKFLKYAKKQGYNIQNFYLNISETPPTQNMGIRQQVIWLFLSMPFLWDNSIIHFGYVKEDCFWHYKSNFDKIVKNIKQIRCFNSIKIAYDLEHTSKSELINKLDKDFYWYCESPVKKGRKITECGTCECCVDHKMAEYKYKIKELEEHNDK